MASSDWDKELAKIDKQLASISDEELMRAGQPPPARGAPKGAPARATAAAGATAPATEPGRRRWGVYLRLAAALALSAGILFWPHAMYSIRCGPNLFLYLGATALITLSGAWSAVWSWRHRAGRAHVLSLLVMAWGVGLAAAQVLPRVGYARPDLNHPTTWFCD